MPRRPLLHLAPTGLGARLVGVAVLLASLAGGSVALSVISNARAALRDEIFQTHLALADLIASQVGTYVTGVENDAIDLADRSQVVVALESGDFSNLDTTLATWQAQHQDRIEELAVYSTDSIMEASSRPAERLSSQAVVMTSANGILQRAVKTGAPTLGYPLRNSLTGHAVIPFYAAAHASDGRIVGVFDSTLSLDALADVLRAERLAPGSRTSVIDITGLRLADTDPRAMLTPSSADLDPASRTARAGKRGTMETTRADGEAVLAAFSPVPGREWAVLFEEPSALAFAPIDGMTRAALVWVSLTMIVAGAIAAALAVSIVRPLRQLRDTAERMASGDLGRRTGMRRGDEIGDLGRTFDRMAAQLDDSVQELRRQALTDNLTLLPNRVLLRQRLEQAIAARARMALLIVDLDRFKEVNDTLGHSSGDALLQQLALRLNAAVRKSDTIARLGGDEFAITLADVDAPTAAAIAEKLRALVCKPFVLEGRIVTVGASIGVACLPEHGPDADTLMRCADVAMYVSKRSGEGVSTYSAAHDENKPERLGLVAELGDAIQQGQLVLAFQPVVDCRRDEVVSVEALVRWQHPRRGLVPPDEFIPLAEQTGVIRRLSRWVLESALREQKRWRGAGLDIVVAVNLSMLDLHDVDLPDAVANMLQAHRVPGGALRVEITESSLMSDPDRALDTLTKLREMGVSVSIDDFGTGYSSLLYLKKLPVDELKIDRSFVREVSVDESDLVIVRSTVDLAHNLGLTVVAEGVEDHATLGLLRALGCDKAQGYVFSRPVFSSDLTRWLTGWQSRTDGVTERAA